MRKYVAPPLAAFFASLNISLAADEKKPEGSAPADAYRPSAFVKGIARGESLGR
jgi:hypothetical protein